MSHLRTEEAKQLYTPANDVAQVQHRFPFAELCALAFAILLAAISTSQPEPKWDYWNYACTILAGVLGICASNITISRLRASFNASAVLLLLVAVVRAYADARVPGTGLRLAFVGTILVALALTVWLAKRSFASAPNQWSWPTAAAFLAVTAAWIAALWRITLL